MSVVAIAKSVKEAFELLGGVKNFIEKNQSVFIKGNWTGGNPNRLGETTNPELVKELIYELKPYNCSISIGESDSNFFKARSNFQRARLYNIIPSDIKITNLSQEPYGTVKLPRLNLSVPLPRCILEVDSLINIPVIKLHILTIVSIGLKNLFGLIPTPKEDYHPTLDELLAHLSLFLKPKLKLTIVDGTWGMEVRGPFKGKPVQLGLVVAGDDPVAVDAVCTHIIGLSPKAIPHIRKAEELRVGTADLAQIRIVGIPLEEVRRPFKLGRTVSKLLKSQMSMVSGS